MAGSSQLTTLGAVGGGDLRAAAEVIANAARRSAAWSSKIPGDIHVGVAGDTAVIWTEAPAAYPNETGARHPVFAHGPRDKWTWVPGNHRPFLGPAADARAGAAMSRYAQKLDRMLRDAGFS